MNWKLPDVQAVFIKGRGTRGQIVNICWIIEKAREFQRNIYFCFIGYTKAFDCLDHNKLWKILKEVGISDHLTCLLRNLYAGQEAAVRTGHGTTDWFQIGKGPSFCQLQGILSWPWVTWGWRLLLPRKVRDGGWQERQAHSTALTSSYIFFFQWTSWLVFGSHRARGGDPTLV